uniref:Uncharacterized protein n=1 Tax=Octopus bimaculoides TaxID=37653 RepID=A0A0L8FG94_OCTBM
MLRVCVCQCVHAYINSLKMPASSLKGRRGNQLQNRVDCWRPLAASSADLQKTHMQTWENERGK